MPCTYERTGYLVFAMKGRTHIDQAMPRNHRAEGVRLAPYGFTIRYGSDVAQTLEHAIAELT
jgi:hypothetical protein